MERRINWLHFSDLHYGQERATFLMPQFKKELFKDIEILTKEIGKWDIVLFTGDLTQSGKKEEFDELNVFLNELWKHFNQFGSNPYLISIPGNHDLLRQDPTKATVKVLNNYNNDPEFQEIFWKNLKKDNEYFELIKQCFQNYTNWYKDLKLPKPELQHGIIPGDISTIIEINGVKLGCIGLNTAFLELSNDDYKEKLAISNQQFYYLTDKDFYKWLTKTDITLLLTHHDPEWYDKNSLQSYNSEINPTDTHFNHFCGHLHLPSSIQHGVIGFKPRRLQIAPSLFGLKKINNELDRIHGYFGGSYIIEEKKIIEFFWPRKLIYKYDKTSGLGPDLGFNLDDKNC